MIELAGIAPELQALGTAGLAAVLGASIGLERELRGKAAGLRTHATVACAAALFVSLGDILVGRFAAGDEARVQSDPIRIVQSIVIGVSFLGGGTIVFHRHRQTVEGLTTAASLLLSASLGVASGLRCFVLAVGVTVIALALLAGLGKLEARLLQRRGRRRAAARPLPVDPRG